MENKLTKFQLLKNLIAKAFSPFSSLETIIDIKNILATSNGFDGFNHLYLVACYLQNDTRIFHLTREQAEQQLNLALSEHCDLAYYYQYLLYKNIDDKKAREGLYIITEFNYGPALLALAKEYESGHLFKKDDQKAYEYYLKATDCREIDAYIGCILLAKKYHDKDAEQKIYQKAEKNHISLPGRVE